MATDNRRRESPSGYHFWNLHQDCGRKFYIKYALGFRPKRTAAPLLFGSAFHAAKAEFYISGGHIGHTVDTFTGEMDSNISEYSDLELYNKSVDKGERMLRSWADKYGYSDLKFYEILFVEKELKPKLPNGYIMTMRPDAIVQSLHDGHVIILETKTTGFSAIVAENAVRLGDQATAYLWGVDQCMPQLDVFGLQPDISYGRQSVVKNIRPDLVFRTKQGLREFAYGTAAEMTEISQKMQNLKHFPAYQLFRRNTMWCTSFSHPCEYADICRTDLTDVPPPGFSSDPWVDYKALMDLDYDLMRRIEVEVVP